MAEFSYQLRTLPSEVFQSCLSFLNALDIFRLFFTGDVEVQRRMKAHTGVSWSVDLGPTNLFLSWPSIIDYLRPTAFSVSQYAQPSLLYFMKGINLGALPETLVRLELDCCNGFLALAALNCKTPLRNRFPRLSHLDISRLQRIPSDNSLTTSLFLNLPDSLMFLALSHVPIDIDEINGVLPDSITYLSVLISKLSTPTGHRWPASLVDLHLTLDAVAGVGDPVIYFPATLTRLIWRSTRPERDDSEYWRPTKAQLAKIPQQLQVLELSQATLSLEALHMLPKGLKTLFLRMGSAKAIAQALPNTLISCLMHSSTAMRSSQIRQHVPNFIAWNNSAVVLDEEIKPTSPWISLFLRRLEDRYVQALPDSLVDLEIEDCQLTIEGMTAFSRLKIKSLSLPNVKPGSSLTSSSIGFLPRTLVKLRISIPIRFRNARSLDWPPQLQDLRLRNQQELSATDFAVEDLPVSLISLELDSFYMNDFPQWSLLPRGLHQLILRSTLSERRLAKVFGDQTAKELPPGLHTLWLTGFDNSLTPSGYRLLPRSLRSFKADFDKSWRLQLLSEEIMSAMPPFLVFTATPLISQSGDKQLAAANEHVNKWLQTRHYIQLKAELDRLEAAS